MLQDLTFCDGMKDLEKLNGGQVSLDNNSINLMT